MPIFDHFDFLASRYETFIPARPPKTLLQLLRLPIQSTLLDAGGGTGRIAQHLTQAAQSVIVIDLSYPMLRQAQKKPGLRPVRSQTEHLPFASDSFARIVMVDALHHVYNQAQTIQELWRVLQPGGLLIIEEPDIRSFGVKLIALGEKLALMRSHFLSPTHIAELFNAPEAKIKIHTEQSTAWIIAHKPPQPT
jgi:demethylmenaquinone methyltransferase/2-methoxy-6-polyprenyl-1,4-benzoquinol methylase